ncbi:hypothetical protein [Geomicrobium sp. JCM 19038]|uniref:hypothetical protein n=1 Tax=Geomicrobium sp. JCM 19038 TaxID=1460635 RepID=UPI00187C7D9C|nr:hypothetical protein [Geomicrobium sp. JCM 19038]
MFVEKSLRYVKLFLVMYETGQIANFTDAALIALASIVMLHASLVFVFHRYVF